MALTASQVAAAYRGGRNTSQAAASLKVDPDHLRKRLKRLLATGELQTDPRPSYKARRYVITSAQNNTPVHSRFLQSLKAYCSHWDAELLIIPIKYENITLTQKNGKDDLWWASEVVPHLCRERVKLNDNLVVMAEINVNATNKNPLSGFETVTGKRSGIFGHGQLEMKVIPTPLSKLPKKLHTTGSVTQPSYSETKAGHIAQDNHCTGALVAEVHGSKFWIRQLRGNNDGSFYDLNLKFTPEGAESSPTIKGLVCGDIHWDYICPRVLSATFTGATSIVTTLRPECVVLHDVFDGYSGSHHHAKDPLLKYHKAFHRRDRVRDELDRLIEGLAIMGRTQKVLLVDSNHNRHFNRWLNECRPETDHVNADLYYEVRLAQVRQAQSVEDPRRLMDPLEWYIKTYAPKLDVEFVSHDSGAALGKYCIDNHGDVGSNGSRGSAQQFTKFGGYYIIGHSHTPAIVKNVIQVGTSSVLNPPYVSGPSSWLNSHAIVYPDGNASLVDIIEGRWRA